MSKLIQQLSGRLGNQLFQWAFAHKLAAKYQAQVSLFMDSSHSNGFKGDDLSSNFPKCQHIEFVNRNDFAGLLLKTFDKMYMSYPTQTRKIETKLNLLRSKNSYLIPRLPTTAPFLITGFYINSRNVEDIEITIFNELLEVLKNVSIPESLPERYQYIHIRRGDFVTSDKSYGLLGTDHYKRLIDNALPLIVGTDDSEAATSVIEKLSPELIFTPNNSTAWGALKMMAEAESLVLANSTLSWWGGFVASNRNKTVYSPSPFYKDDFKNDDALQYRKFTKVESLFE